MCNFMFSTTLDIDTVAEQKTILLPTTSGCLVTEEKKNTHTLDFPQSEPIVWFKSFQIEDIRTLTN